MISEEFKKNIESGNLITIRSALVDYLFVDRTFRKFDESLAEASKSIQIIEPYDGGEIDTVGPWTKDYLNAQKVALMVNFSEERIGHIKKVLVDVLGENVTQEKKQNAVNTTTQREREVGRKVISETEISGSSSTNNQKRTNTGNSRTTSSAGKRTGRMVISEKTEKIESSDEKKANGLIIGGAIVSVVGGAAVANGGGLLAGAALVVGIGTAGAGLYKKYIE